MLSAGLCKKEGSQLRRQNAAKVPHCSPPRKLDPTRADDPVYVLYNRRCTLMSREPVQFASWLDEDVQLLPAGCV